MEHLISLKKNPNTYLTHLLWKEYYILAMKFDVRSLTGFYVCKFYNCKISSVSSKIEFTLQYHSQSESNTLKTFINRIVQYLLACLQEQPNFPPSPCVVEIFDSIKFFHVYYHPIFSNGFCFQCSIIFYINE